MDGTTQDVSQLIVPRVVALVLMIIWSFVAIFYAKGKHYFSKPLAADFLPVRGWQLFSVFIAYLGTYFILLPLVVRIVGLCSPDFAARISLEDAQAQIWVYLGATAVAVILVAGVAITTNKSHWRAIWGHDETQQNRSHQWIKNAGLGFCTWLLAFPLVNVVGQIFGLGVLLLHGPFDTEQVAVLYVKMTMPYPWLFSCTVFAVVVLIPFVEELLFRGFLLSWLRKYFSAKWSIVCSALVFALFHYAASQGWGNFELLPSLFVLACFLGYLFERQRSLWASYALHATFNAFGLALLVIDAKV